MTESNTQNSERSQIPLSDCPKTPKCVCTVASRAAQRMACPKLLVDGPQALSAIRDVVDSLPRTRVEFLADGRLHATFRSKIFRFVDDVEFYVDQDRHELHFRSASRIGYSDMGVNRQRMQAILQRLVELKIIAPAA